MPRKSASEVSAAALREKLDTSTRGSFSACSESSPARDAIGNPRVASRPATRSAGKSSTSSLKSRLGFSGGASRAPRRVAIGPQRELAAPRTKTPRRRGVVAIRYGRDKTFCQRRAR